MNIDFDENEIEKYAQQRMRQIIDKKVNDRFQEMEFYGTINSIIQDDVRAKITNEMIENTIKFMDRDKLIQNISKSIAEYLVDKLYSGY